MDTSARSGELRVEPPSGINALINRLIGDRDWARATYLALLALTSALYLWGLDRNGYANSYYSAAVLAGTRSWKAFFFGSFDAGNFITIDKPPASLWLMELSGRLFGFSPWSLLLPEALLGVATVALVFTIVRRSFGPVAGLIAALVTALTPVAALMFRFNNPDALLTFLLVASAWALLRSIETGRTRWLLLSAAIVGLAFNTKYLQAYIVLPALIVTYFLLGPGSWARRSGHLLAAAGVLLVSSGWWIAAVSLIPASDRPFIGGSTDNTLLNLVLGYDGFGRLTGALGSFGRGAAGATGRVFGGGVGGPGGGFGGQAGLLRLFNSQLGGQISWLLPIAGVSIGVGLWARRGRARTDLARAGYVLWGLWLLTHAVVFSFASGILHPYYVVAMAPAVGALVGGGVVDLWRLRSRSPIAGAIAAAALLVTAWWGSRLLARTPDFAPGLRTIELALAVVAAAVLLVPRSFRLPERLPPTALAVGLAAILLGPSAYTVYTVGHAQNGADPSAGPSMAAGVGPAAGAARFAAGAQGVSTGQARDGFGANTDTTLLSYLEQHQGSATWLVAVSSANQAASIQLATGRPVLAMGGFSGSDPAMTVSKLQDLVRSGRLRYVLVGGGPGGFGGGPNGSSADGGPPSIDGGQVTAPDAGSSMTQSVTTWVAQNCTAVTGVSNLYDCSVTPTTTSRAATAPLARDDGQQDT